MNLNNGEKFEVGTVEGERQVNGVVGIHKLIVNKSQRKSRINHPNEVYENITAPFRRTTIYCSCVWDQVPTSIIVYFQDLCEQWQLVVPRFPMLNWGNFLICVSSQGEI